jgi:hypothetical protein
MKALRQRWSQRNLLNELSLLGLKIAKHERRLMWLHHSSIAPLAAPSRCTLATISIRLRHWEIVAPAFPLPGNARLDWWIIQEIAPRIGLDWSYAGPAPSTHGCPDPGKG